MSIINIAGIFIKARYNKRLFYIIITVKNKEYIN